MRDVFSKAATGRGYVEHGRSPGPDYGLTPSTRMDKRLERWFLGSVGIVLSVVALAKLFSAVEEARILDFPDPILDLPFRYVMLLVALLELLVASACLFSHDTPLNLGLVACLGTSFGVYRAGLWIVGWQRPCGCMGSLMGLLRLSPNSADNLMKAILLYLLTGSYLLLFIHLRRLRS